MIYTPPPTHGHEGLAVITIKRGSDLHRDPTMIGRVVQRAEIEFPGLPIVIDVVDDVCEEVRDE